jgi:N-hydroxyarylamine O-acetyltransferase
MPRLSKHVHSTSFAKHDEIRAGHEKMNIDAYLKRINYSGSLEPTAETLRDLQVAHLLAVPFENLSIHAGEPIVLNEDSLFDKIVGNRRGGFCYEANGLFAGLLRALGFEVTMLSAGVAKKEGGFGPDFDHMTLMVTLAERWLVDVGFGDSFLEPLLLDSRDEQVQGTRAFRIVEDNSHLILQRRDQGGDGEPQYRFTLQPHTFADYEQMCHFHQTSPESHFTKAPLCSVATADGRVTLSGLRLITTTAQQRDEHPLENRDAFDRILRDQFRIVMKNRVRIN